MSRAVLWFRRDLRLSDHPALCQAAQSGEVVPLLVLDPRLLRSGGVRTDRLLQSARALSESMDGALVVRQGAAESEVAQVVRESGADSVHVSRETTPYGRVRDALVTQELSRLGVPLVATGSPYAVGPGRLHTAAGTPFQVFTPYLRAWRAHGWPQPARPPEGLRWAAGIESHPLPAPSGPEPSWDQPGESAALVRWREFLDTRLAGYQQDRNRPDLDTTSRLSVPLKYGEAHPRTLLAQMQGRSRFRSGELEDATRFVTELCWREFYADVLWHQPESAWQNLRDDLAPMEYADERDPTVAAAVQAWREGRTGYPMVDAGMRQLRAQGWMHNRVRMLTASFLVKDLHVWWPVGARHFLALLRDGDLASNNHNWQWVAGTGTDAAPYVRVFNPVTQGRRFDPAGDYVRRWVPELSHLAGGDVHEPWRHPDGYLHGYPARIVEHDVERAEALRRHSRARDGARGSGRPRGQEAAS